MSKLRLKIIAPLLSFIFLALYSAQGFTQAVQIPPGEQCFQATTGINGFVGTLGTLTPGSGGTNGTYPNVPLTGGTGTGATANITVSGGVVTAVQIFSPGVNYSVADVLSASSGNIGGVTGFSVLVGSISINSAVAGGYVGMYQPSTLTPATTWKDAGQTILNTNPISLDSNGCAVIYGVGTYRQILYDSLGNVVWDKNTSVPNVASFAGTSGGTANAQTVSASNFNIGDGQQIIFRAILANTGAMTLTPNGGSPISVYKDVPTPTPLSGGEISAGSMVTVTYDAVASVFHLTSVDNVVIPSNNTTFTGVVTFSNPPILTKGASTPSGPVSMPNGRLTLTSGSPVMTTDVAGAAVVYFTPYLGNSIPLYDGTNWTPVWFSEVSQALSDTTKSPAATTANSAYDVFAWNDGGTFRATRGPAWSSTTVRSAGTALTLQNGIWVNQSAITNGPAASRGVYIGSFTTNGSNQVAWLANPAAASGGGNANLGLWNMYNRVPVAATSIDSASSYSYGGGLRVANNSNNNRISYFSGMPEGAITADVMFNPSSGNSATDIGGLGLDTTASLTVAAFNYGDFNNTQTQTSTAVYRNVALLGLHFFQALENGSKTYGNATGFVWRLSFQGMM